jgi:hypothetical protein
MKPSGSGTTRILVVFHKHADPYRTGKPVEKWKQDYEQSDAQAHKQNGIFFERKRHQTLTVKYHQGNKKRHPQRHCKRIADIGRAEIETRLGLEILSAVGAFLVHFCKTFGVRRFGDEQLALLTSGTSKGEY